MQLSRPFLPLAPSFQKKSFAREEKYILENINFLEIYNKWSYHSIDVWAQLLISFLSWLSSLWSSFYPGILLPPPRGKEVPQWVCCLSKLMAAEQFSFYLLKRPRTLFLYGVMCCCFQLYWNTITLWSLSGPAHSSAASFLAPANLLLHLPVIFSSCNTFNDHETYWRSIITQQENKCE